MLRLCLAVASLALLTSRLVCVVLLANRLSLVLPYLLSYHTLLPSAVISKSPAYPHGRIFGQPIQIPLAMVQQSLPPACERRPLDKALPGSAHYVWLPPQYRVASSHGI